MVSIGEKIRYLRKQKNVTQEELAAVLHISFQAVSKWENGMSQPDIAMIPVISNYFGVTIDELFGYKLNAMTYKEQFIQFMVNNGALKFKLENSEPGKVPEFSINTERYDTNAQVWKIGRFFADCIRENNIELDTLMGLAYHGIAFSAAAGMALFDKYGITVNYCYDRLVPDSRGRIICGHTPEDGERVVIIDDLIFSGSTLIERIEGLKAIAKIEVAAIIVITDFMTAKENEVITGAQRIEERYGAKVYSVITREDIVRAVRNNIIAGWDYLINV